MAAYTNPFKIANGLVLDFAIQSADTVNDNFVGYNAAGEAVKYTSIPASRVSVGGNLTEASSNVLTITGGTGAVLTSGLSIQVKLASTSQSGYLSAADWNTFNGKVGTSLAAGRLFVGNASNVATAVDITGDVVFSNAGVTAISTGVILNADINGSAAIAQSKMAVLTASLVMATDGSGFATTVAGFTTTIGGYMITLTSNVQTQLNDKDTKIMGLSGAGISTGAGTTGYAITWDNPNNRWTLSPVGAGGSVTGPGASTSTAVVRWNGIGGTSLSNSGVLIDGSNNITGANSLLVANSGIKITDPSGTYNMTIAVGGAYTAIRILTITQGDAARTITLTGNPTLANWFDQDVRAAAGPTFFSVLTSNAGGLQIIDTSAAFTLKITTGSALTAGRTLTLSPGDASRTLTINASGTVYVTGGTDVALADGGTASSLADPAANSLWGWDDTDNTIGFWTIGAGLTYTHASHTLSCSAGITNSAANHEIMVSDGTNATGTKLYSATNGNLTMGSASVVGNRTLTATNTAVTADLILVSDHYIQINNYLFLNAVNMEFNNVSGSTVNFTGLLAFHDVTGSGMTFDTLSFTIGQAASTTAYLGITGTSGSNNGASLSFTGGAAYGSSGNGTGGSVSLASGVPHGAGAETAVNIQTRSTGKLGFYNVTAIVQPTTAGATATFVANAGTGVNDASTFDGYTLKQIAKALRNLGLLA